MTITVLLTCAGGELSPLMIRMLKTSTRHTVRVVAVDMREDAAGRHFADVFCTVPAGDAPSYIDAMLDIVKSNGVNLVVPTSDEEALALSAHRSAFTALGCDLACAEYDTLRVLADKGAAYQQMRRVGLPVPDWKSANTRDELGTVIEEMITAHGDLIVKPVTARGGRGVVGIVENSMDVPEGSRENRVTADRFFKDILPNYDDALPAMIMPRLEEPVHDLDMLAWRGSPIRVVPRRRVNSALPNEGHVILDAPDLIDLGNRVIAEFSLSWLYDCDIMFDAKGVPWILEINPRQSGSIAASIVAGVPLLDDMLSLAKGEPVPDVDLPANSVIIPFKSLGLSK